MINLPRAENPTIARAVNKMLNWLKQDRPIFAWMPTLIWASVIFLFSILPYSGNIQFTVGYFDKAAHFFEYAILAALMVRTINRIWGYPSVKKFLFTLILGTGYGIVMELMQRFIPGRDASVGDAVFDVAGMVFGIILGRFILWRK